MDTLHDKTLYYNPDYSNFVVGYRGPFKEQMDTIPYASGDIINNVLGIIAVKPADINKLVKDVPSIILIDFKPIFVLQDISPSSIDNINTVKVNPYLNLSGKDVLVGIIDTGIDYLNEEFIKEDDTSRIFSIWDQNINPSSNTSLYIGEEYSNEQINNAIKASKNNLDPYQIVPSKDEVGHGTKVAGIIGARGYTPTFQGVANACQFVIVNLMQSADFKQHLATNGINPTPVYNSSEVLAGIEYVKNIAIKSKKPMVIFLGVGTTEGSHDGLNIITKYFASIGNIRGIALVTGTGNEGDSQGHVSRYISNKNDVKTVELKIPREIKDFSFNIWIQKPNRASITVISPTGESSKLIKSKIDASQDVKFVFVDTNMLVKYYTPEYFTGHEVINIHFKNIKQGIWKFSLTGEYITNGRFDIWLPPQSTLPEGTFFLESDPFNTLTIPSTALNTVTVAYYGNNNSLMSSSGKGFNSNNIINPDISTLGVNILTTKVSGGVDLFSGSSAASAIIAGACALLLEWGIIYKHDPTMYSKKIRSYLMHGANRNKLFTYPNEETGYGDFNLLGVFDFISRAYNRSLSPSNKFIEYYVNKLFIRIPNNDMEDF